MDPLAPVIASVIRNGFIIKDSYSTSHEFYSTTPNSDAIDCVSIHLELNQKKGKTLPFLIKS